MPAGRQIEIPVIIDGAEEPRRIQADDFNADADLIQRLLNEGGPQRDILTPRCGIEPQIEAHATRAAPMPGFIQQAVRLGTVEGVLRHIRRVEIGRGRRDRPRANLGEGAQEVFDEEGDIQRMRNGAAHADIGQDRVAEIEFQRIRARIALIAARGHFKAWVAPKPREIGDGKCREGAEQQLPGFHLRRCR